MTEPTPDGRKTLSPFRWSNAWAIANSRLPQASAFIPAIGYAVLWSDDFGRWIGSKDKLGDGILVTSLDARLQLLWWGAVFMTVGWLIYLIFCPRIVRRSGEPENYVIEQVGMRNFIALYHAREAAIEHLKRFDQNDVQTEVFPGITSGALRQSCGNVHDGCFEPEMGETVARLFSYQYQIADHGRFWLRLSAVALLCLGALLFLIPSADVF